MAGLFDDLIPGAKPGAAGGGMFDDLIPKKPKDGQMKSGFKRSFEEVPGMLAGVGAFAADVVGADETRDSLLGYAKRKQDEVGAAHAGDAQSITDAWDGKVGWLDFLANASGYVAGQALQSLATGGLGAMGGKWVASQGAKQLAEATAAKAIAAGATEEAAKIAAASAVKSAANKAMGIGAAGGALAQNMNMELGSIYPDAVEQADKEGRTLDGGDKFRVFAAASLAAGVDTAGEAIMATRMLKGSGSSAKTFLGRAAREVPAGMAREAGTEAVQTGIEQWGAAKPLDVRDIVDSAGVGAVGGMLGGAIGARKGPEAPKKDVADVLAAPDLDTAINFFMEAVTKPAKNEDKPLELATGADGLPFEADPRFAGAPILRGGERPAAPVFGSKQQADIYIGEQALFQSHEAVEVAPGRWQAQPTAATRALLGLDKPAPLPTPDARELSDEERQAYANKVPLSYSKALRNMPQPEVSDSGVSPQDVGLLPTQSLDDEGNAIPAGEAQELYRLPRNLPVSVVDPNTPPAAPRDTIPAPAPRQPGPIPTGEATEFETLPVGEVLEGDLLARDGQPFGSKTGAQAKAYASGGGKVVAIPNHFGSGIPGYVVRPLMQARPNNTRGTDARDLPRSSNDDQRDLAGSAEQVPGASDGRGADAARSGGAVGLVPAAPGRVDQPAEAPSTGNRPADVVAGAGDADTALTPGSRVTLNGTPYTVTTVNGSAVKLQGADGGIKMVARNSKTFGQIQPEAATEPVESTPFPSADAAEIDAARAAWSESRSEANRQRLQRALGKEAPLPPVATGMFDPEAFDRERNTRIKASREAGNTHLDQVPAYVETMRGKDVYGVHDTKVRGRILTVDNNGNVYVEWLDKYSQDNEGATPMKMGKRQVMQSSLGPRDLKDYVAGKPQEPNEAARPQAQAAGAEGTAPAAAPAPAAPAVVPGAGTPGVEADGLKQRYFASVGITMTMPEAAAKVKELEAEQRARKKAAASAPSKILQRADDEAASRVATLARKLRDDIKQFADSFPDARAELEQSAPGVEADGVKPRKTLQEARADAALDRPVRENGEQMTRRQWVERKVAEGLKTKVTQEDRIKPMSRMAYFRANNEEQRAHDRKVKEAGKKDVFWIGDYEVTKTEHDYANALTAEKAATPNAAAPASTQAPAPVAGAPAAAAPPVDVVLQNRDRSTPSSIGQMQSIAANPDYTRLGFSRDFTQGAPVVAGGAIPKAQLGRQDRVAAGGRQIQVQYAVVEAADLMASNLADGTPVNGYATAQDRIRAIAGNGRVAGLQEAHNRGRAATYAKDLLADDLHGVSPAAIRAMKQPVLVRVMPQSEVTADIGDISNTTGTLELSATEQARNDARRVSLDALEFAEDGSITPQSARRFVQAMPQSEQGGLIDTDGSPTRQAIDRLNAAVFATAYDSDALVRLYAQATDPEARNVLSALAQAAPSMARLKGAGDLDIRPLVTQAAEQAVNARRRGIKLADMAAQSDLDTDPDVAIILKLFADNARSVKPIAEALTRAADFAHEEATKAGFDMFGEVSRASRADVLAKTGVANDPRRPESVEVPAGRQSAAEDVERRPQGPSRQADAGRDQGNQPAGPAGSEAEGLTLSLGASAVLARESLELPATKRQQDSPWGEHATGRYIITVQQFTGGPGSAVYAVHSSRSGGMVATYTAEMPGQALEAGEFRKLNEAAKSLFDRVQRANEAGLLTAQTADDLKAKTDREEAARRAEKSAHDAEQARLKKADEDRDNRARADKTVNDFQLGQSAEQQMSGMGDLFAAPAPAPAQTPAAPAQQAAAILDAAAEPPKGAERLSVIKDVKSGAITPEEVAAAYPAAPVAVDEVVAAEPAQNTPPVEAPAPAAPEATAAGPAPMPAVGGISMSLAQQAHSGTSFVPERRAEQERDSFKGALKDAWDRAARIAGTDPAAIARITEVFADVADGYRARYTATLQARSRVMSSMISGPARFPVERNRKRLETERKRAEEASEFLARGIKRLIRAARGPIDNSPESELERVRLNLSQREELQETMKAANAALRKDDDAALEDLGFTAEQIADLKKGSKWERGFPAYRLTNNNAEIRRLRERLQSAEERMQDAAAGPVETERPGVRIVEDATDDRLRLIFDGKPSEEVRNDLKANGFKWSPKNDAWQRQLTDNARYAAKQVLDKHYPADDAQAGGEAKFSRRRMTPAERADNFSVWGGSAPVVDREQASTRGFKTGEAVVVEAYHGTARPDRVGTVFQTKRATSGPMAFFTSDPTLASSYAQGKEDTSIGEDYDGDYSQWFKVKTPGRRAQDVAGAWWSLTPEQRDKITDLAPRVVTREDDDGNTSIELADEGTTNGVGNYEYEYRKSRNPLRALVENWLASGMLFNEEQDFLKVLKTAGFPMDQVEYDSPRAKYPFVYKTFIRMGNPLVTSDIPQRTMDALEQAAKRDRSRPAAGGADQWDKNTRTLREWVAQLKAGDGQSVYVWTSIPDKVTEVLKAQGHDGIIDWSGKGGGNIVAPVYIPFTETQVKSAIGNKGTFDPDKKDILYSRAPGRSVELEAADAVGREFWRKIDNGESFTDQEVLDALSINRRGSRRIARGMVAPADIAGVGIAPIEWQGDLASFGTYTSSASWDGDNFNVFFVPESLAQGADLSDYAQARDRALVHVSFRLADDGRYEISYNDPPAASTALLAAEKAGVAAKAGTAANEYRRIDLDAGDVQSREITQEAIRRLALNIGQTPAVFYPRRETGARAGQENTGRGWSKDYVREKFSRAPGSRTGVPMQDAEAVADAIRAAYPTGPQIVVLDDVRKAPEQLLDQIRAVQAANTVEGAYYKGKIYLFPQNVADIQRLMFVGAHHEIRHAGLDALFGKKKNAMMYVIAMRNPRIKAAADEKKASGLVDSMVAGVEEVLADMPLEDMAKLNGWNKIVAAVRQWLRGMADKLQRNHPKLAAMIRPDEWTDNDVAALIRRAEDISRGGTVPARPGGAVFARAYHGTPYRGIDKFSTDAIGTGEGAQAYGWGLYFASKREVAEHYRETLSARDAKGYVDAHLNARRLVERFNGDPEWAAEVVKEQRDALAPSEENYTRLDQTLKFIESGDYAKPLPERGQLYEVEVPENNELLLWDRPVRDQPEAIREAIYSASPGKWMTGASGERRFIQPPDANMTGGAAYARISRLLGGDRQASDALRAAGVKGMKYLDGGSRSATGAGWRVRFKNGQYAAQVFPTEQTARDAASSTQYNNVDGVQYLEDGSFNYVIFSGDDVAIQQALFSRADQTQTPAFRRWFGDSKVVDAHGKPLRVYHGTRESFDAFDPARQSDRAWYGKGFYFAADPQAAGGIGLQRPDDSLPSYESLEFSASFNGAGFAWQNQQWTLNRPLTAADTRKVVQRLQTKMALRDAREDMGTAQRWRSVMRAAEAGPEALTRELEANGDAWGVLDKIGVAREIASSPNVMPVYLSIKNPAIWPAKPGPEHDGIHDPEKGYWIAFKPEQIKSATGNNGDFNPESADIRFSRAGTAKTTAQDLLNSNGGVFGRAGDTRQDRVRAVVDGSRPFWLGALTRDQIADMYGDELPPVRDYDNLTRAMENERQGAAQKADELYEEWSKIDAEANDRLARVMLDATVAQVHPDRDTLPATATEEQKQAHGRLRVQFKLLPKDAQAMYGKVRDFHANTLKDLRAALEGRIERLIDNGSERAVALADIRARFDKYMQGGPYFPLHRFGDFLVVAERAKDGERVVAAYENAGEQQAAARALEADGFAVKLRMAKVYARSTDGSAGKFIGDVLAAIDKMDMREASINGSATTMKAQLLDDLNQLFIKALPDLSYRKHFTHRKGTAGFSADVMRGFASSAFHAAGHIARLNHGDKMTFALEDAYQQIKLAPEGNFTKVDQVLNEMTLRHEAALNPNVSPLSALATQVGFVMYLGLSPAAGLINMMQVPMVALPYIGARYGFAKATAAMGRAYTDIMGAKPNAKNGFNAAQSPKLSADERRAISTLQDEGVIDLTQAHDLAAATTRDVGNQARNKASFAIARAMRIVGWTFHVPEVMNRQVTALMAYRLEMAKSGNEGKAMDAAREAIKRSQFDYSSSNRARFMQGDIARVVTQFRQFSQNMTYFLGRAAYQALKGEDPEVRRIARQQLVATFLVTGAMAGSLGLPGLGFFAGLVQALVNAMGDDDDEPWDWKVAYRNALADNFGKEWGEVMARGVPRALMPAWDISNRVSLSDLWWRDSSRDSDSPREAYASDLGNILGPTAGTLLGWYTASDHMARGDYAKAVESVVPKFIRDPLKAWRESQDGVTSYNGEQLLELTGAEVAGRFLGFAPSRASEMYEGRNAVMGIKTALEDRRERLIAKMAKARIDGDTEVVAEMQQRIRDWNTENPKMAITGATIVRSVLNRRRNTANTEKGITLPDSKDFLRDRARFAEVD